MVVSGIVCYSIGFYGMVWYGVVWHYNVSYRMVVPSVVLYGMDGIVSYAMVCYGM